MANEYLEEFQADVGSFSNDTPLEAIRFDVLMGM